MNTTDPLIREAFSGHSRDGPAFSVILHDYLGLACDAVGRTDEAIEQCETLWDVWTSTDPVLAAVEDAKARLAPLRTES